MTAFNNNPGGCCCKAGGWFDVWVTYNLPNAPAPGTWGGTLTLQGFMRTYDSQGRPWDWEPGVNHWWNAYELENWFIVPAITPSAVGPLRDFGPDVYTEELDGNETFWIVNYQGVEIGRVDKQLLIDAFGLPIYNIPVSHDYTIIPDIGGAVPPLVQVSTVSQSIRAWGLNYNGFGYAALYWRHPNGLTMLSASLEGIPGYEHDGQPAGFIDYVVWHGGTWRGRPSNAGMAGYLGQGKECFWCKAVTFKPRGITDNNEAEKLDYYDGATVSTGYTSKAETLWSAQDLFGVYMLDGTALAAQVTYTETETIDSISSHDMAFGVKYSQITGTGFGMDTGINTKQMFLEFHAGTPRIVGDDSGFKYVKFVDHTADNSTVVCRVECDVEWGQTYEGNGPSFYIAPLPGFWAWGHAAGDVVTGIVAFYTKTGGFGVNIDDGNWTLRWYIKGNMVREVKLPPGRFLPNQLPLEPLSVPAHAYLGLPYAREVDGGGEVANITGIFTEVPGPTNGGEGQILVADRNFELVLYNGSGGIRFRSEPLKGTSRIVGGIRNWFVVVVDGVHTAEEYTGGKCCFYSPNTQRSGALYLVNSTGMVPMGYMLPDKVDGKIVIHPYTGPHGLMFGAIDNPVASWPTFGWTLDYYFSYPTDAPDFKKKPEVFGTPGTLGEMYAQASQFTYP